MIRRFEFSPEQAYLLELGDSYVRFFAEGGQLVVQPTGAAITNGTFSSGITGWTDASTGGAAAIQLGGGVALVPAATGTAVGNMTAGGGLAAAFDGSYDQDGGDAASRVGAPSCAVGKHWTSGTKTVGKLVLNPTADKGFRDGTGHGITVRLEGSSDNFASSVVLLYEDTFSDDRGDYVADSGIDTSAAYAYHRARLSSPDSTTWYVSEVEFHEVAGAGSLRLVGDAGQTAVGRQAIAIPSANLNQEHVVGFRVDADIDRTVKVRLGTSAGGAQILADQALGPGWHLLAFTPSASPAYLDFRYDAGADSAAVSAVSLLGSGASAPVPLEVPSPWSPADLPNLRTAQVRDLLHVVDGAHRPHKIVRRAAASWSVQQAFLDRGPFADEDPANTVGVSADAVSGDITLTADSDLFRPGDVGSTWRICAANGYPAYKSWFADDTGVSANNYRISGDYVYQATNTGTTGNTAPVHTQGTVSDGGVSWRFVNTQGWGVALITAYASPTSVSARVLVELDKSVVNGGTTVFRKPALSDADGWPDACQMYASRMIYAKDARFYMSSVGKFDTFDPARARDDDAVQEELGGEGLSSIAWIRGRNRLLLGTSTGPWVLRSNTLDEPITPANIQARAQNASGAAALDAFNADDAVVYFGRSLRRLFELTYQFQIDGYTTAELTETADHILGGGVVEAALAQDPWTSLWCVRKDGQLAVLTYDRAQGTVGWSRVVLGATAAGAAVVESVATVPGKGATAGRDEVWLLVRRTVGGQVRRFVEYLDDIVDSDASPADAWFVDAGLAYEGAPTRTVSGLGHLEGETVAVCADGQDQARKVVTGGAIALDHAASKVVAGLPCPWRWRGLKIAEGTQTGPGLGVKRKIDHVLVGMIGTGHLLVGNGRVFEPVPMRSPDDAMDAAVPLFAGERKPNFPPGWSLDARVELRGDTTLPATVTHLEIQVSTNEAV